MPRRRFLLISRRLRILALTTALALSACVVFRGRPPLRKARETDNPHRMIVLTPRDVIAAKRIVPLPEDLRMVGWADETGRTVRVLTREIQMEWLRAAGLHIVAETAYVPRVVLDPIFASRRGSPPTVDAEGRLRTDDGYRDAEMAAALLRAFAERYPNITRLEELGRSHQGRPLLALLITDHPDEMEDEPSLFFDGQHHGDEVYSAEPVFDMIQYLTERYDSDPRVRGWVDENRIWCMPVVNPDGLDRFWYISASVGRTNARDLNGDGKLMPSEGVDLNRNYPFMWGQGGKHASLDVPGSQFRGLYPGSEPETQAILRLAAREHFVASVSYHTVATSLLVPYTIDGAVNPFPSVAWIMAREVGPLLDSHRPHRKYRIRRHLYAVDGTDQDWHLSAHGTQAFLLELPFHNSDFARDRNPMCEGVRPLWMYLLDRLPRGPSVSGHVVDACTGRPLVADVSVEEIRWSMGERHSTLPGTGRFDRFLPVPGTYHVRAECRGYEPATVEVNVGEEWKWVEVEMQPVADAGGVGPPT